MWEIETCCYGTFTSFCCSYSEFTLSLEDNSLVIAIDRFDPGRHPKECGMCESLVVVLLPLVVVLAVLLE